MEERFWSKVKKTNGCWFWQGCILGGGYGQFRIKSKRIYAHRVAFELVNGEIPRDKFVLHSCDNTICVNPSHLRLGSHKENMVEMAQRTRVSGQKLSISDVYDIRRRLKNGESPRQIALSYDCERTNIYHILSGKSWSHI